MLIADDLSGDGHPFGAWTKSTPQGESVCIPTSPWSGSDIDQRGAGSEPASNGYGVLVSHF